jgi:hypothetical protein
MSIAEELVPPVQTLTLVRFFRPREILELVLSELHRTGSIRWQSCDNRREVELASEAGPATRVERRPGQRPRNLARKPVAADRYPSAEDALVKRVSSQSRVVLD